MSIISVKIENSTKQDREYPYLGICAQQEVIVFFTAPGKGMMIHSDDGLHVIGEYRANWLEDNFTKFDGQVILQNT